MMAYFNEAHPDGRDLQREQAMCENIFAVLVSYDDSSLEQLIVTTKK